MESILTAISLIFQPYVMMIIAISAIYGLFVGSVNSRADGDHGDGPAGAGDIFYGPGTGLGGHRYHGSHGDFRR